jgi:hypothetical protein
MFNNRTYVNQTLTDAVPGVSDTSAGFSFQGGIVVLGAYGVLFGAGTVRVEHQLDGVTWVPLLTQDGANKFLTATGTVTLRLAPGQYRVTLNGSTASSVPAYLGTCDAFGA